MIAGLAVGRPGGLERVHGRLVGVRRGRLDRVRLEQAAALQRWQVGWGRRERDGVQVARLCVRGQGGGGRGAAQRGLEGLRPSTGALVVDRQEPGRLVPLQVCVLDAEGHLVGQRHLAPAEEQQHQQEHGDERGGGAGERLPRARRLGRRARRGHRQELARCHEQGPDPQADQVHLIPVVPAHLGEGGVEGDKLVIETAGAGGYGPPSERSRDALARDAADGKVSPEAAVRDYGIAVAKS